MQREMSRPVRIGDLAQITLADEVQTHPIEFIDGDRIYIATGESSSSVLIPVNGEYQVEGLNIDHQVEFISNDSPTLTGLHELDLTLLEELDDKDLEILCQVNDYIRDLCEDEQLWKNKIIRRYGRVVFNQKSPGLTFREYYDYLESFISVAGANLALVRNDQPLLDHITSMGYQPDIHKFGYLRGNIKAYRFKQEVVDFLQEADLGPQIMGAFPKYKLDVSTIKAVENTRLNDILWFLQRTINGQVNPLYGIALRPFSTSDIFTELLFHHLYQNRACKSVSHTATDAMRKYLGNIMRNMIDAGVTEIQQYEPSMAQLIQEKGNLAKRAIDDPTLEFSGRVIIGRISYEIFNPNSFMGIEFLDYVYEPEEIHLSAEYRDEVVRVYSIIPNLSSQWNLDGINAIERRVIELAKNYQMAFVRPC